MAERLQKIISRSGLCSRRAAEELIVNGRVIVNGRAASLGDSADTEADEIFVDGKKITLDKKHTYIMLNKPRGYVTTLSDESGRKTVNDLIKDINVRLYPVGRLDMHSEGLLLMTDDGDLTYKLTHPKHEIYKEYLVKITYDDGIPPESPEAVLSRPLTVDGIKLLPAKCRLIEKTGEGSFIITISIREGKNRQIRRMCVSCGYTVNSLKRVAVGNIRLGDLPTGCYRYLDRSEIDYLKKK